MPDYTAAVIAFIGKDKVSPALNAMKNTLNNFGSEANAAFNKASKSGSRFGDVVKGVVVASVLHRAIGAIENGVVGGIEQFAAFDDAIVGAAARFDDIGIKSKDFNGQVALLGKNVRAMATGKYTAVEMAQGIDSLAKAGYKSTESIGILKSMMNLAITTGEEFASTASYSSDLLNAFNLNSDKTATKIANMNRLNDVLALSANLSNVGLEDLFETMKTVGPISQITGTSLEEVAAATALIGNAGIKGTEAATALKNAMLRLATKDVYKMLKANNIEVENSNKNFNKFSTILGAIGQKIGKLGTVKQAQILNDVFGLRAIAGSSKLITNLGKFAELEEANRKAAETSAKTAAIIETSLGNRLLKIKTMAIEVGIRILESFGSQGKTGIDNFVVAMNNFDVKPIVSGIRMAINVVQVLYSVIKPFIPMIPFLVTYFVAFKAVVGAIKLYEAAKMFLFLFGVVRSLAGGMLALNAVMLVNPAVLIASSVALLITGLVYLEKRFGLVGKAWQKLKGMFVDDKPKPIQKFGEVGITGAIKSPEIRRFIAARERANLVAAMSSHSGARSSDWLFNSFRNWDSTPKEAPNAKEAAAHRINFTGRIDIAGAPPGTKVSSQTTGAPMISLHKMGANP